jgi:hypothetical protein
MDQPFNQPFSAFPWLGFIFWLGLFTWFGIRAWARYLAEQERQKTLRVFAERGTPLDKEMMEKLFPKSPWQQQGHPGVPWQRATEATCRGLTIGGIVCLFAGIGLLIGAQLIGRIEPDALYAMSTGGVMAVCVGLGLIVSARVVRRTQSGEQARSSGTGDDAR